MSKIQLECIDENLRMIFSFFPCIKIVIFLKWKTLLYCYLGLFVQKLVEIAKDSIVN